MMSPSVTWVLFFFSSVVHGQEIFNTLPPPVMTSFTCKGRDTGFYADIESNCRVYHTCDDHGNKFTYHCPQDTAFRQDSLVCDHAYRVDCQKSAELIQHTEQSTINTDNNQDSGSYSRSYRIVPKPSINLLAPKSSDQQPTTFVMTSTMFFRDQSNFQNNNRQPKSQKLIQLNLPTTSTTPSTTTTKRYFENLGFKNPTKPSTAFNKPKTSISENDSSAERFQSNEQKIVNSKSLFFNNNNYPYVETLKSMQKNYNNYFNYNVNNNSNKNKNNNNNNNNNRNNISSTLRTTTGRTTTAGTEFPIPKFGDALSGFNSDDPYYPRNSNTEKPYSLSTKNKQQKFLAFTTPRSSVNSKPLEIPDSLPDLNSVEDLVDRRKLLFIPPAKKF